MKLRVVFAIEILLTLANLSQICVAKRVRQDCACGIANDEVSQRIVGGRISRPHIFPWVVPILVRGRLNCGGALINDRYILTAAHCAYGHSPDDLAVGLGIHDIETDLENPKNIVPVIESKTVPSFNRTENIDLNDMALMKLAHRVNFTENIQPVCLPEAGSQYYGKRAIISGWGHVRQGSRTSKYLRQAVVKVKSQDLCKRSILGKHITNTNLCAYALRKDACQGDSGGPLISRRTNGRFDSIGIVSWGEGCAKIGYPGVYVDNEKFLSWIYEETKDAVYCSADN